jgi:hypothetical protein
VLQLTGSGLLVKCLDVALLGDLERCFDVDFDELTRQRHLADHAALSAKRRDKGGQYDETCIRHELRDFADTADILDTIRIGESQIPVEAMAYVVAVKQKTALAKRVKFFLHQICDDGFSRTAQARKPQQSRMLVLEAGVSVTIDIERLPMSCSRAFPG